MSVNGIPPVQITTNATNIAANTASLRTLNSGKQATITTVNAPTIKTTLGLTNVNNTTDLLKPVSTATQTALGGKQDAVTTATATTIKTTLGLHNVNNTTDALKPVSTSTQTALGGKLSISGVVAPLILKTQYGYVDSPPALTLFHETAHTTKSHTAIELKVKNNSNYNNGDHEPSVKMVYQYDNGDVLGSGSTPPAFGQVYYSFIDRVSGGTSTLHTGPYFFSTGQADFAGGSLTGVSQIGDDSQSGVTNVTTHSKLVTHSAIYLIKKAARARPLN